MAQFTQVGAIFAVLGLLWLTLQALRRYRTTEPGTPALRIHQRVSITNGCHLVVVRWDGQDLLLSAGSQGCTIVATRAVPLDPRPAVSKGACA
jgi:hypothetical protein